MSDRMTQNEIDALMDQSRLQAGQTIPDGIGLSSTEIDTLGEIGNTSMGAAATALYSIIDRKVKITTPEVSVTNLNKLAQAQSIPFALVSVEYTEGFVGNNLYILRTDDVKAITDIMMGGEGTISEEDLSELHVSAISEAMNQMMGGMATALADMFDRVINISPPTSMVITLADQKVRELMPDDEADMIQISFKMEIEGLADSRIMQLIPLEFGRQLVGGIDHMESEPAPKPAPEPVPAALPEAFSIPDTPPVPPEAPTAVGGPTVDVRPIQLSSFDAAGAADDMDGEGLDIILDVPLQVSVELGRCRKTIKEVMDINVGSIITLDRIAGEPVDVVVNGKIIARGEVIVIDDNYGIRITEVLATNRLRTRR